MVPLRRAPRSTSSRRQTRPAAPGSADPGTGAARGLTHHLAFEVDDLEAAVHASRRERRPARRRPDAARRRRRRRSSSSTRTATSSSSSSGRARTRATRPRAHRSAASRGIRASGPPPVAKAVGARYREPPGRAGARPRGQALSRPRARVLHQKLAIELPATSPSSRSATSAGSPSAPPGSPTSASP